IRDGHVTGVQTCALPIWGGLGVYYGGMFGKSAGAVFGNARVTYENYNRLKQDMTMAEVEALLGSGKPATAGDVKDMIMSDPAARSEERRVGKGGRRRWVA